MMNQFTIFCTPNQTKRALKLGAPIQFETLGGSSHFDMQYPISPTAEEMCGWLRTEKKIFVVVRPYVSIHHEDKYDTMLVNLCNGHTLNVKEGCDGCPEATLAGIDSALEYLESIAH